MLLLKIYPSLYGGVVFLKIATDGNFTTSSDKLFDDLATKEVLPNISRTERLWVY